MSTTQTSHQQKSNTINSYKLVGTTLPSKSFSLNEKNASMYALSIGFGHDPNRFSDLKYIHEQHQEFTLVPTVLAVLRRDVIKQIAGLQYIPNTFDSNSSLITNVRFQCFKPQLTLGENYIEKVEIINVEDSKDRVKCDRSKIFLRHNYVEKDQKGKQQLVGYAITGNMVKGISGFACQGNEIMKTLPLAPIRKPDHILQDAVFPQQALTYSLISKTNPIHFHPQIAKSQGQEVNLSSHCLLGMIAKKFIQEIFANDSKKFRAIQMDYKALPLLDDKYKIKVWKEDGYYFFQQIAQQRDKIVAEGVVEIREQAKF